MGIFRFIGSVKSHFGAFFSSLFLKIKFSFGCFDALAKNMKKFLPIQNANVSDHWKNLALGIYHAESGIKTQFSTLHNQWICALMNQESKIIKNPISDFVKSPLNYIKTIEEGKNFFASCKNTGYFLMIFGVGGIVLLTLSIAEIIKVSKHNKVYFDFIHNIVLFLVVALGAFALIMFTIIYVAFIKQYKVVSCYKQLKEGKAVEKCNANSLTNTPNLLLIFFVICFVATMNLGCYWQFCEFDALSELNIVVLTASLVLMLLSFVVCMYLLNVVYRPNIPKFLTLDSGESTILDLCHNHSNIGKKMNSIMAESRAYYSIQKDHGNKIDKIFIEAALMEKFTPQASWKLNLLKKPTMSKILECMMAYFSFHSNQVLDLNSMEPDKKNYIKYNVIYDEEQVQYVECPNFEEKLCKNSIFDAKVAALIVHKDHDDRIKAHIYHI